LHLHDAMGDGWDTSLKLSQLCPPFLIKVAMPL
jgi:hypothetical protein